MLFMLTTRRAPPACSGAAPTRSSCCALLCAAARRGAAAARSGAKQPGLLPGCGFSVVRVRTDRSVDRAIEKSGRNAGHHTPGARRSSRARPLQHACPPAAHGRAPRAAGAGREGRDAVQRRQFASPAVPTCRRQVPAAAGARATRRRGRGGGAAPKRAARARVPDHHRQRVEGVSVPELEERPNVCTRAAGVLAEGRLEPEARARPRGRPSRARGARARRAGRGCRRRPRRRAAAPAAPATHPIACFEMLCFDRKIRGTGVLSKTRELG